jgi:hypothetical protein
MKNALGWLFAIALISTTSCGFGPGDACDDYCDCQGCSDRDYDECVDQLEDVERDADYRGCNDEYDDLLGCVGDTGYCSHGDNYRYDCDPEASRLDRCLRD